MPNSSFPSCPIPTRARIRTLFNKLDEAEQLNELFASIKDPKMAQKELLKKFEALSADLKLKLTYPLWVAQHRPDDDTPITQRVQANVRCLKPFIPDMIKERIC